MHLPDFLIDRYKEWKENIFPKKQELLKLLVRNGQKPKAMIISCCDSRVNTSNIFSAIEGDFFEHRNIANLVPPFESNNENGTLSAIEYAIKVLKVRNLLICGHSSCGGIKHAYDYFSNKKTDRNLYIDKWIDVIKPAFNQIQNTKDVIEGQKSLEQLSIINSITNLNNSKLIKDAILNKNLNIFGLWFNISTGSLFVYNQENNNFENINY